jgi:hypothetical protein
MDNEQGTMIDYSDEASPFFKVNKSELENFLKCDQQFSVKGWCNAYGFDIELWTADGVYMNYVKSQLSHQDPVIPRRATNLYRFKLVKKTNRTGYCYFGKSSWLFFWLHTKILEGNKFKLKEVDSSTVEAINHILKMTQAEKCLLKNGEIIAWSRKQQGTVAHVPI